MKKVLTLLVIAGIIALFYFVIIPKVQGEGNAKICGMTPGGMVSSSPNCWVTLKFKKVPPDINVKDVRLVFTSIAIEGEQTLDWNYISGNASVPKKQGVGRETPKEVKQGEAPPLDFEFDVNCPLNLKSSLETSDSLNLTAELYWGGRKQSTRTTSIRFLYKKSF